MSQLLSTPLQSGFRFLQPPLPAASTVRLAATPALARGRDIGLTLFRLNDTNDVVPACTPAACKSVCSKSRMEQPAACLLARAYQRLWLFDVDDAYGSSHMLDISLSPALPPPWRWQCEKAPRGAPSVETDRGPLSRQLSTQPLPATPMPIGYCGRNRRFSSTNPPVLNNHSNDFKSHPDSHPACFRPTLAGCAAGVEFLLLHLPHAALTEDKDPNEES